MNGRLLLLLSEVLVAPLTLPEIANAHTDSDAGDGHVKRRVERTSAWS